MTLIQWTSNQNTGNSTTVPIDGLLTGTASKQITLNYTGSGNAITVAPNAQAPNTDWSRSATIENLIIDGQSPSSNTGILLNDIYNCRINNLTIRNFNIGIHITADNNNWSEVNTIKHVRMENVQTGILLDSGTGSGSFAFTVIDDVGIQLANSGSAVGIQIGTGPSALTAKPYSSYIKANVWEQSAGGTAMKLINGEVKYGLINLAVQGPSNGYGVDISNTPTGSVYNNQDGNFPGFLLSAGGLTTTNAVYNPLGYTHDINYYTY